MAITLGLHPRKGGSIPPLPTKYNELLVDAYRRGYRVIDGIVYSFTGKKLKTRIEKTKGKYLVFSLKINNKNRNLRVHRLVAYQKFGDRLFEPGIETRHLDNNKLNNLDENIGIGTHSENMMDLPREKRIEISSQANLKYDHEAVKEFHSQCRSYIQTMRKFGISSKGTLWNILN